MSPEHDTDPTAAPPTSGNTTDPTFPPKIGKQGPKAVKVTAVQGPGVDPQPKEVTTTERLLTGLLDGPKQPNPPRKKDSSGDDAAAYSASPRPVPVAHKEQEEPAVIVAPPSLRRPKDDAENGVAKSTRDEPTVELPRTRRRRLAPIVGAAVGGLLILLSYFMLRTPSAPAPAPAPPAVVSTPLTTTPIPPPEPTSVVPPSDTLPEPVIESQKLPHPRSSAPAPHPSVSAAPPAPAVSAAPPSSASAAAPKTTASPIAPDFDELKKGIKH